MKILETAGWEDYELLDSGNGQKLERFGKYLLSRPEPQAIWQKSLPEKEWQKADAIFSKDQWKKKNDFPDSWRVKYQNLSFSLRLTPFKHTGLFPEQTLHWDWLREKIRNTKRVVKILNLFGYTGGATLTAAAEGARVVHVDASKPTISWARQNQELSGLKNSPIRWIVDDALKFVSREIKRKQFYDALLMDPPAFGHGPQGQVWKFLSSFPKLLNLCRQLLVSQPTFVLVNAYAISSSALMLNNIMQQFTQNWSGNLESGELIIRQKSAKIALSTGIFSRWANL